MSKQRKLLILSVVSFLLSMHNPLYAVECPKELNLVSYETQNHDGHSNYSHDVVTNNIKNLVKEYDIGRNTPVLDIGGGYGNTTYALMRLGFKNIYFNDLDKDNLACASRYLKKSFHKESSSIRYIAGDINSDKVIHQLPGNHFGLVVIRNVLQFFTAEQLNTLLISLDSKMKKNGYLYIVVENGTSSKMLHTIDAQVIAYDNAIKKLHPNAEQAQNIMDAAVRDYYPGFNCRVSDYFAFPSKEKRLFLFSCNRPGKNTYDGHVVYAQLYSPLLLTKILDKYSFKTITTQIHIGNGNNDGITSDNRDYFVLIAKKM